MTKIDSNLVGERLAKLETDITYIKQEQKTSSDANQFEHQEIKEMLGNFIKTADSKYASKTVEKAVYGLIGVIMTAVFIGLMSLLF